MNRRQSLENIPIEKINILNPRERNRKIANEIKKNIEDVGLKRPITVSRRLDFTDGKEYDLVCGQGRLEAYIANNQTEIPAIVIDADEEETLIMSLVENIARRNYSPTELLQQAVVSRGRTSDQCRLYRSHTAKRGNRYFGCR